jgi:hypothetical protein
MEYAMKNETKEILFVLLTLPISIPMIAILSSRRISELGKKFPYHPRFINWVWTVWARYFWLPCPLCKRNFGGHEWKADLFTSPGQGMGVCPKCVDKAKEWNKEIYGY